MDHMHPTSSTHRPLRHPTTTSHGRASRARLVGVLVFVLALVAPLAIVTATAHPWHTTSSSRQTLEPSAMDSSDGFIPSGSYVSPFDNSSAAISRLNPSLRAAVQSAARAAKADHVWFVITSGWRSKRYQTWLYDTAVKAHGAAVARETVAKPGTSAHEAGDAVDIGWTDADSWMMQHGSTFGLCQIYSNEIWHYELATTQGGQCPLQVADANAR